MAISWGLHRDFCLYLLDSKTNWSVRKEIFSSRFDKKIKISKSFSEQKLNYMRMSIKWKIAPFFVYIRNLHIRILIASFSEQFEIYYIIVSFYDQISAEWKLIISIPKSFRRSYEIECVPLYFTRQCQMSLNHMKV